MITLTRTDFSANETFGEMHTEDGDFLCYTIERPWLNNQHNVSCIPAGTYDVEEFNSPKHGNVWHVLNVPQRDMIEIHPANFASELLGCIGVGDEIGLIGGVPAVLHSQNTFTELKSILPDKFQLTIIGESND